MDNTENKTPDCDGKKDKHPEENESLVDTRKELKTLLFLKEIGLPQTATKFIDIHLVGESFCISDASNIQLNTKVFEFVMNNQATVDTELLFDYQEEFGEWDKLEFEKLSPVLKKRLRIFLREHSVDPGRLRGILFHNSNHFLLLTSRLFGIKTKLAQ
ncbi:hypothetical protein GcM3_059037 [Golovinomyces cichoracearum]|uniref:Uncharacterized protein n=1 Tax=Golovinomyces cichoracearum TaxID=62708 RepID=A0A420IWX8_9PEZI|nr:hypothetical protein GcM3_059037 [Golovinomyces cichoracearum]